MFRDYRDHDCLRLDILLETDCIGDDMGDLFDGDCAIATGVTGGTAMVFHHTG